jgi:predicted small secreted protein
MMSPTCIIHNVFFELPSNVSHAYVEVGGIRAYGLMNDINSLLTDITGSWSPVDHQNYTETEEGAKLYDAGMVLFCRSINSGYDTTTLDTATIASELAGSFESLDQHM